MQILIVQRYLAIDTAGADEHVIELHGIVLIAQIDEGIPFLLVTPAPAWSPARY